jgi:ADP-ribose pyrophosphatase YjhB (NUDIX family)
MKNKLIHVIARAVIISDNHLLLAYDPRSSPMPYYELDKGYFYLPGGHVEHGEGAADAVIREIEEETGFLGEVESFLGVFENAWSFPGD